MKSYGERCWPRRSTVTTTCSGRSSRPRRVRARPRRVAARPLSRRARAARRSGRPRDPQRRHRRARRAPSPTRRTARRARARARRTCPRIRTRSPPGGALMTAAGIPNSKSTRATRRCYVRGVAHDVYRWMRENDPVHRDEKNGLWVISKYEDVSYVERSPDLFCSKQGVRPKGGGADNLSIVSMDDPEHAHQRRLVSRGFTPSRINAAHGTHSRARPRADRQRRGARRMRLRQRHRQAAAADRDRRDARPAGRRSRAARGLVRHDDGG